MAGEMPASSAQLISRHSRLLGVHLNDGYGLRDDGLMVGTVNPAATAELFVELLRIGYDGVIYFDTFPDLSGIDPAEETKTNLLQAERLAGLAEQLSGSAELKGAVAMQNAAASQRIVSRLLRRT